MFVQLLTSLREQMQASLSRTDVLRPMTWLVGILLLGTLLAFSAGLPQIVSHSIAVMLGISVALYIAAYLFCLFTDKDALRSERYSLNKMAIERGLFGDNVTGLLREEETVIEISSDKITKSDEQQ